MVDYARDACRGNTTTGCNRDDDPQGQVSRSPAFSPHRALTIEKRDCSRRGKVARSSDSPELDPSAGSQERPQSGGVITGLTFEIGDIARLERDGDGRTSRPINLHSDLMFTGLNENLNRLPAMNGPNNRVVNNDLVTPRTVYPAPSSSRDPECGASHSVWDRHRTRRQLSMQGRRPALSARASQPGAPSA